MSQVRFKPGALEGLETASFTAVDNEQIIQDLVDRVGLAVCRLEGVRVSFASNPPTLESIIIDLPDGSIGYFQVCEFTQRVVLHRSLGNGINVMNMVGSNCDVTAIVNELYLQNLSDLSQPITRKRNVDWAKDGF